jgi:short-subunit dehydrogenase
VLIGGDTRAIVTGASRGIGRETARELAARGATLGLVARGKDGVEELAAELPPPAGGKHLALAADVAKRSAIEKATERFVKRAGGLDLVVANAGIAHYTPFPDQDPDEVEEMVRVNVLGTLWTVRAALGHMLGRGSGHIVVLSSGAGLRAFPWAAVYGATKAADRAFAEALRHELSGTGVGLTTVFPGEVETDLHAHEPHRLPDWRDAEGAVAPEAVAAAIVAGVESGDRNVYVPAAVRALGLNGVAPKLTDALLRRVRGATAAPRRD